MSTTYEMLRFPDGSLMGCDRVRRVETLRGVFLLTGQPWIKPRVLVRYSDPDGGPDRLKVIATESVEEATALRERIMAVVAERSSNAPGAGGGDVGSIPAGRSHAVRASLSPPFGGG